MAPALPIIAVGAALAGTAVATYSAVKQGQAASQSASFQANQASQNAQIATQQGVEDQRAFNIFSRQQIGAISEGYGASGVSGTQGSAQDMIESGARESELDSLKIKYGASLKAAGYTNTATLSSTEANAASTGGYLSAAGTLLGGGAKAGYYTSGSGGSSSPSYAGLGYGASNGVGAGAAGLDF